ncbi:Ig-like domain-containing protein [Mycobacterium sp. JS623]|uniref:Ig-like domain-containing protein n=1 Tax=Mycobacterium sp. JS623 TaxID=212767 RepID=UPI00059EA80F|nr:Ig-like domain-containing protein [Mycobacterium sp. JS623]
METQAQAPAAIPSTTGAHLVSTFVSSVLAPFVAPGPATPAGSPLLLAVLAWARREVERALPSESPTTVSNLTASSQPIGEVPVTELPQSPSFARMAALVTNTPPAATAPPTVGAPDPVTGVVSGNLNVADAETSPLIYTVSGTPAGGTVTVNSANGIYTYTPTQAARLRAGLTPSADTDSFTVTASDGELSVAVPVTVTISPTVLSVGTPVAGGDGPSFGAISPDGTRAYVGNVNAGTISVINTATNAVVATVPVGASPYGVTLNTAGTRAYVANLGANSVSVINTATNTVVATVPVGSLPSDVALSADGAWAYVTNAGSNTISVINTSTNTVVAAVPATGTPASIAVSPNGATAYVTKLNGSAVTAYSTTTGALLATIPVGAQPFGVAFSPDGTRAYVTSLNPGRVTVIDTATNTVVGSPIPVGAGAYDVAVSGDGSLAYVTSQTAGTFTVIDTKTNTVIGTPVAVGGSPIGVVVSPDGAHLLVANQASDTVTPIWVVTDAPPTVTGPPTVVLGDTAIGAVTGALNVTDSEPLSYTVTGTPARGTVTVNAATGTYTYVPTSAARLAAGQTPGADSDTFTVTVGDGSTTVAVPVTVPVRPAALSVTTPVTVDGTPAFGAVSPDGSRAYITNFNGTVSVINTVTNTVIATVPAGTTPFGVAVNPAGTRAYVTNLNSANITVINTANNSVLATIPVGNGPAGVAVSPDGTRAYVTNSSSGTVSVINATNNMVLGTIPVGTTPANVSFNTDGTRAYVTNLNSNTVSVINTATNAVVATVPVGSQPFGVDVSPDGTRAYVTNFSADSVSVINTTTNTVVGQPIPVGDAPYGIAVSPGGLAFVTNSGSDSVSVINTATNTVAMTIPVGDGPVGVALSQDGTKAYVINQNARTVTTISLNALPDNVAPGGQASAAEPDTETGTLTVTITASDPDGDAVTITPPSPTTGTLLPTGSVTTNGVTTATYSYTPNQDARDAAAATQGVDTDTLTFTVTDAAGASTPVSVTVTIAPTVDNGLVGQPILLAGTPSQTRMSPDGTRVYEYSQVVDPETGVRSTVVQIIDTTSGTQVGSSITRPGYAYNGDLQFSADGKRAYLITRSYDNQSSSTFTVVDVATGAEIGTPVSVTGSGYGLTGFNDDRSRYYLSGYDSASGTTDFVIVNTETGTVVGDRLAITGNAYPQLNADKSRAVFTGYSSDYRTATVTVVDMETASIIGGPTSLTAAGNSGYVDVRITDDGKRVLMVARPDYYQSSLPSALRIIDAETGAVLAQDVTVDHSFRRIDFPSYNDYSKVYLISDPGNDYQDYTFTVLDTTTGDIVGDVVSMQGYYQEPVFDADHSRAYLSSYTYSQETGEASTLTIVDTHSGLVVGEPIPFDTEFYGLTLSEDGTRALITQNHYDYVNNRTTSSLTTVDTENGRIVGQPVDVDGYYSNSLQVVNGYAYLLGGTSTYSNDDYRYHYTTEMAVVDIRTGTQVGQQTLLDGSLRKLEFVGDRGYLTAVSNYDYYNATGSLVVIDAESGVVLGQPVVVSGNLPYADYGLDFNEDGSRLFFRGYNRSNDNISLRIVNTETGALVGDSLLAGHSFQYAYENQEQSRIYLAEQNQSGSPATTFTIMNVEDGTVLGRPVQLDGYYQSLQRDYAGYRSYFMTHDESQTVTRVAVIDEATGLPVNTPLTIQGYDRYGYLRFNDDGSLAAYAVNSYQYDPVQQTNVYTRKAGLIDAETGTLIGSPVPVANSDYYSSDVVFNSDDTRVHFVSYTQITGSCGNGCTYYTARPSGVTTLDTRTGALVGPAITLGALNNSVDFNDEGTRAYVTTSDESANTVAFTVYNLDTGEAAPTVTIDAYRGQLKETKWLIDGSRVVLVGVSYDADGGRTTTMALVDTDTGLVLGAPVVLGGDPGYQSPNLSADESQITLSTYDYTASTSVTRSVVIDTRTGAVLNPLPEGTLSSGTFQTPNGKTVTVYTHVDDVENPDRSTMEMVFVVGDAEPIVVHGYSSVYSYGSSPFSYSADGNTMYVFTIDGEYYSGNYDPASIRTRFLAIDLTTGTALGDGPVEVGGIPISGYNYGYGALGNLVMRTKQIAADGSVSTRLIFLDRETSVLTTLDVEGEGYTSDWYGDNSLRVRYTPSSATRAIQVTHIDGAGGSITRLTMVDLVTGDVVGQPIVLAGTERGYTYNYQDDGYYELTQTTAADGSATTALTRIDWSTGTVSGDPVNIDGAVYGYTFNEDRTQMYVTTKITNADGSFSYFFHIVPVGDSVAAQV